MLLTTLRKDLRFNGELLSLVDTLKNIAGSQYHLMEKDRQRFDRYMNAFATFFRVINLADIDDPLVRASTDVTGLVVVTSDSGFMGGLNQGVLRAGFAAVRDVPAGRVAPMVVGEKGAGWLRDQQRDFTFFPGVTQSREVVYARAAEIRDHIVREVKAGRMGRVIVAYPRALSFTTQTIETQTILPCGALFNAGVVSEVSQRTHIGRFIADSHRVVVESRPAEILGYLASTWVASKLYEVLEASKLAEFSARAMHLEGSVQNVERQQKKLQHMCFKATHERIDKGMRESFAAKSIKRKTRNAGAA
jgi:ATP synthase F1 gamma subunit